MLNGLRRPVVFVTSIAAFLFYTKPFFSQTREIDSMRTQLVNGLRDTSMVMTMKLLSYSFYKREMYDSAKKYALSALALCDKIKYKKGMTGCYESIGLIAFDQGKYSDALQNFLKSYQIATELNYQKGISHSTNDLGLVYYYTGDYATALKYYLESLKIKEQQGDTMAIANTYNNIADVYKEEGNPEEAHVYLDKLVKLDNETKDSLGMAYTYSSLGEIYLRLNKWDSALYYENKANILGKIVNNNIVRAYSSSYIGDILYNEDNYEGAFTEYRKALSIADSIGDKEILSMIYYNLGKVRVKMDKFPEADSFYNRSLAIARNINDKKKIMQDYLALTNYDSLSGDNNAVLSDYEKYILYRDSIFNENSARKIENEKLSYEFDKQQAEAKAESDRRIQRQKLFKNVFIFGFGLALLFSIVFFLQRIKIGKEKKRSDHLLLNILPAETAEELKTKGSTRAKGYEMVTVLFTDFKDFTKVTEQLSAQELVNEINYCYSKFDNIVSYFGIEKIKTLGDGYMAAGGLPVENKTNAVDTVKAALAIRNFIEEEKQKRLDEGKPFFEIRIGVHTGPVVAGVVGVRKFAYDIWGDTVNIASRMESSGEAGKVNISGATYELVKDQFNCSYRGKVHAKNKGEIDMYFVKGW